TNVEFDVAVASYTLPTLLTAVDSVLNVANGSTLSVPALTAWTDGDVNLDPGSAFVAPALANFSGSTLTITPDVTFATAPLSNIDGARFFVQGGVDFSSAVATTFNGDYRESQTIMEADGVGSTLDLATLTSFTANDQTIGFDTLTVRASRDGMVDLSNLTSAASNDKLRFHLQTGGQIDLSNLQTAENIEFDVENPTYVLPSLETASGSTITAATGTTLSAPELTALTGSTVDLAGGATFDAPKLADIQGSTINIAADQNFNSAPLANINSARFFVQAGGDFDNVVATAYASSFTFGQTIMEVDGSASRLDLSTLTSFVADRTGPGTSKLSVIASNGGTIDLSSTTTLASNDRLEFLATSGGTIDLSSTQSAIGVELHAASGGVIRIGSLQALDSAAVSAVDLNSRIDVAGDFGPSASTTVQISAGGELSVAENFSFDHLVETDFILDSAIVRLEGTDDQLLEVGGEDAGANGFSQDGTGVNFGIGQLVVGKATQRTTVELIDVVDNGNRGPGGEPESLYLYGLGGPAGLEIFDNSALILNGINVYAWDAVAGEQVHLNSLFGPGEVRIPFDRGFLQTIPLNFRWFNSSGGDFAAATNWSDNTPPLASDPATWGLGSAAGYGVSFGADTVTDAAIVTNDNVTFDLGGFTYSTPALDATAGLVVAQNPSDFGRLTLLNGTLNTRNGRVGAAVESTGALTVAATGRLEVNERLLVGGGTGTLTIESGGTAQIDAGLVLATGGRLEGAGMINAAVDNQSGAIAPGSFAAPGELSIVGNVMLGAAANLEFELGGTDNTSPSSLEFDVLDIDGSLTLGGTLAISLTDLGGGQFLPAAGDQFQIVRTTGQITGVFGSYELPNAAGLTWLLGNDGQQLVLALTDVPADFDSDGTVSGSDFLVWQNGLGITSGATLAEGDSDGDGDVDATDLANWEQQYGFVLIENSANLTFVPEPTSAMLLLTAVALMLRHRRLEVNRTNARKH
ncbi:MAG: dockerin type I domain-containing protein, partial [Bythopirellula sp.]